MSDIYYFHVLCYDMLYINFFEAHKLDLYIILTLMVVVSVVYHLVGGHVHRCRRIHYRDGLVPFLTWGGTSG